MASKEQIQEWARSSDVQKRVKAAEEAEASPQVLESLAEDWRRSVRRAVAENTRTPADVLELLVDDESAEVRKRAAQNPSVPQEILSLLEKAGSRSDLQHLSDSSPVVKSPGRSLFLEKPEKERISEVCGIGAFRRIRHYYAYSLRNLSTWDWVEPAANPGLPPGFLSDGEREQLVASGLHGGRSIDLSEPVRELDSLTQAEQERLLQLGPYGRWLLAMHPKTSGEVLVRLAEDPHWAVRWAVARNEQTPADTLAQLAGDQRPEVRGTVAINPAASSDVLKQLATDEDPDVRTEVVEHPRMSEEILDLLVKAGSRPGLTGRSERTPDPLTDADRSQLLNLGPYGRQLVAAHPDTPTDTLKEMAEDWPREVASNPSAPPDLLRKLVRNVPAGGRAEKVKEAAGSNPAVPADLLETLAESASISVAAAVAANPAAPSEVLRRLGKSENPRVRGAVASNPSAPSGAARSANAD